MSKSILIIEDDLSIANELKEMLDNAGYNAKTVDDFHNVLAEIKKEKPDLILLDINLPKINGEILLQQIRKEYKRNKKVIKMHWKNKNDNVK